MKIILNYFRNMRVASITQEFKPYLICIGTIDKDPNYNYIKVCCGTDVLAGETDLTSKCKNISSDIIPFIKGATASGASFVSTVCKTTVQISFIWTKSRRLISMPVDLPTRWDIAGYIFIRL